MPSSQPRRPLPGMALAAALIGLLAQAAIVHAHGYHRRDADEDPVIDRLAPVPPATAPALPSAPVATAAPKRLYIANDDHTDYMWAANEAGYAAALPNMLDQYMTQAETTATYPVDGRGRFNADGTLWVWTYEHSRTPDQIQRLWNHVRAGDITVPLNTCVQLYGAMPTEAVLRSLYYAGHLERREGVRLPLVVPMEDVTLPGGVASLWAGAGARYSWKGVCDCTTPIAAYDRPREIYRFTGPDGGSVLMKWDSSHDGNTGVGGYAEARDPYHAVDYMDTDPGFLTRWPWPVAAAFGYGWDGVQSFTSLFLQASRDLTNATRRVIVSNEVDFFQDFEAAYGASLPAYGASFGNDWDLLPASLAAPTAAVRRSVEKLRTAEALATVAALQDPTVTAGLESARDSMNLACGLYYEHSWSAGPAVSEAARADWQRRTATALGSYVDALYARALARVGSLVPAPPGDERHLVFNPLSWTRTDVVDLVVAMPPPYHVVDLVSGLEVPSQSMVVDGQMRARILARDVPSVGYRVYDVVHGAGGTFPPSATVNGSTLDNGIYKVTVGDHGQLTSVIDHKDGDRELVAAGRSVLELFGAGGPLTLESTGPVSTTLTNVATGPPAHTTRVTLYAGIDRIDVAGRVTQNFSNEVSHESWFSYTTPTTRHEEVGMIARAARLAQGGDYADENARTDWLTLNHFVDMGEGPRGVTLSALESPFFKLGVSRPDSLDANSPHLTTVVGMPATDASLGITAQGGDTQFDSHYALRTRGAWDPAAAMRFALEHQDPLVETRVTGGAGAPLPEESWSLITIDSPDVLLWALKPAEEGIPSGIIARAWNLADAPRTATIGLPAFGLNSATSTTDIETDLADAPLSLGALPVSLARQQMRTWRLVPDTVAGVPPGALSRPSLSVYPNPAHARTASHLTFALATPARVRLTVHDVRGARVATLVDGPLGAGAHAVDWDAAGVRPGVYFARLEVAGGSATRRLVVLD